MNAVYFLSDVHLGIGDATHEDVKKQRLVQLLRKIRPDARRLVIAGDLFDFWFEYSSVIPRGYHAVLTAIEELVRAGTTVSYVPGNHDFAIGDFFSRDLGVQVVKDHVSFKEDGKNFYVCHGDGLAEKDAGYRVLKKIIRSRLALGSFRFLHPGFGFRLARLFSASSRDYTSNKFYGESDGMYLEAQRLLNTGIDYVVMGHRHLPLKKKIGDGWYVNLGDWLSHYSYAVWRDGALSMYTCKNDREEALKD